MRKSTIWSEPFLETIDSVAERQFFTFLLVPYSSPLQDGLRECVSELGDRQTSVDLDRLVSCPSPHTEVTM